MTVKHQYLPSGEGSKWWRDWTIGYLERRVALEQKCNGNMCQLTLFLFISISHWLSLYWINFDKWLSSGRFKCDVNREAATRSYGPNVPLKSRKLHCKNILQLISRNKYYQPNLNIPLVWYLYCWKLVKQVNWSHFISPDSAIQNMVQSLVLIVILFHSSFEFWPQTSRLTNIKQLL